MVQFFMQHLWVLHDVVLGFMRQCCKTRYTCSTIIGHLHDTLNPLSIEPLKYKCWEALETVASHPDDV